MRNIVKLILLTLAASLTSCGLEDVSDTKEYNHLIGQQHITISEVLIYGIADYPGSKSIEYYVIMPKPGMDDPQIAYRATLPEGTIFVVDRIESSSLLGERVWVTMKSYEQFNVAPIYLSRLGKHDLVTERGERRFLNPKFYREYGD